MPKPVTLSYRVEEENEGHTTITLFVGRNPGARARAGKLVFRTDEWEELLRSDEWGELQRWVSPNERRSLQDLWKDPQAR